MFPGSTGQSKKVKNIMIRQISFGQYRAIDLTILSVLLVICQFLTYLATSFWFPEQL